MHRRQWIQDLKFTGQVRDGVIRRRGWTQFGYRYLSGAQGRSMSPGPFNAGSDPGKSAELEHVQLAKNI